MRLDLYLRNAGLFKQRSQAKQACDEDRVQVDGKPARPGQEVRSGQVISVSGATQWTEAEVLEIPLRPAPRKERGKYLRILRAEPRDPDEDLRF